MNIIIKKHFMEARVCDNNKKQKESQKNRGSGGAGGGDFFGISFCFRDGYIALMTVLIAGLAATSITVSLLLLGTSETKMVISQEVSHRAKAYANACAEEALQQIRSSTGFSGSGVIPFGADSCSYTVTNTGGENREITAIGNASSAVRKIKITITIIVPLIIISSWQEVADL